MARACACSACSACSAVDSHTLHVCARVLRSGRTRAWVQVFVEKLVDFSLLPESKGMKKNFHRIRCRLPCVYPRARPLAATTCPRLLPRSSCCLWHALCRRGTN